MQRTAQATNANQIDNAPTFTVATQNPIASSGPTNNTPIQELNPETSTQTMGPPHSS